MQAKQSGSPVNIWPDIHSHRGERVGRRIGLSAGPTHSYPVIRRKHPPHLSTQTLGMKGVLLLHMYFVDEEQATNMFSRTEHRS